MTDTTQSPMSSGNLNDALRELGSTEASRLALVRLLLDYEASIPAGNGVNVRETVSGPIIDAAFGYGCPYTKTLDNGLVFSTRYTSKIIRDFIMSDDPHPDHIWEPQTTKALLNLSKNARNVVIGGAYIGDHAILIANQIRQSGKVHCFELSSDNVRLLSQNASQNKLDNVAINEIGLWSNENVKLRLDGEDSHASPKEDTTGFSVTTVEAYAEKHGINHIDVIMLDIEGGELAALQGAEKFLGLDAQHAPDIIFEIHASYTDWSKGIANTDIVRHLLDRGYAVFGLRDYNSNVSMKGKPVELVELDGMYIEGPAHGFNMLATKRREKLDSSCFKFVQGVSPKLLKHRDPQYHAPLY